MNDPLSLPELLRDYGALGILAYVTVWMTRRFNGKIDRLAASMDRLSDRIEQHIQATEGTRSRR